MDGMEPSKVEFAAMLKVEDLFGWVPIREPQLSEVYATLGLQHDDTPRMLAMMGDEAIQEKLTELQARPDLWSRVGIATEVARKRVGLQPTNEQYEEEKKKQEQKDK